MNHWDDVYERIKNRYEPERLVQIYKKIIKCRQSRTYLLQLMEEFLPVIDDIEFKQIYEYFTSERFDADPLTNYRRVYIHEKLWSLSHKGKEDRKIRETMVLIANKCFMM
jgi:hypothetical protein